MDYKNPKLFGSSVLAYFETGLSFVSQIDFVLRFPVLSLPRSNDSPCDRKLAQTLLILPHSFRSKEKK